MLRRLVIVLVVVLLSASLLLLSVLTVKVLNFSTVQAIEIPPIGESGCVPVHPTTGAPCPECCESQNYDQNDYQDDEVLVDEEPEGCPLPNYERNCNAECTVEGDYETGRMTWYDNECGDACNAEVKAEIENYKKCLSESGPVYTTTQLPATTITTTTTTTTSPPTTTPAPTPEPKQNVTRTAPLIRIGAAAAVDGEVTVIHVDGTTVIHVDGTTEKLSSGKTIYHNDRIISDSKGRLQVLLIDETVFTLGPRTNLVLDDFVYDPDQALADIAVSIPKGVFRFVTGKVKRRQPSKMKIKLPVGTIGIRGTDGIVSYNEDDQTAELHLHEGVVDITTDAGIEIVSQGTSVTFDKTGVISDQELIEDDWESLIEQLTLEEKINYGSILFFIFVVLSNIGLIVYFFVRKKKTDKKRGIISKLVIAVKLLGFFILVFALIGTILYLGGK
jgi:hypothetical protein